MYDQGPIEIVVMSQTTKLFNFIYASVKICFMFTCLKKL